METEFCNEAPIGEEVANAANTDAFASASIAENVSTSAAAPPPMDVEQLHRERIRQYKSSALLLSDPDEALEKWRTGDLYELDMEIVAEMKASSAETGQLDRRLLDSRLRTNGLITQITRVKKSEAADKRKFEMMQQKMVAKDPLLLGPLRDGAS